MRSFKAPPRFLIRDGDRVVFWGDSITDNSYWCRTVETYVRCRYPDYHVDFINLGLGGDTAQAGKIRIQRDLPATRPTLVLINLGMNDAGFAPYRQASCDVYIRSLRDMLHFIRRRTRARVVFISPIPYECGAARDSTGRKRSIWYPQTLRRFSRAMAVFAKASRCTFIDLNRLYQKELNRYQVADPQLTLSHDGIHPGADGNALIAALLLQAMGAEGDLLHLQIDLTKRTAEATHQRITSLTRIPKGIRFTRQPQAFPFQFSGRDVIRLDLKPWQARLNQNTLRVTGLPTPYLLLLVNGRVRATFTRAQAQRGVSLTNLGLPEEAVGTLVGDIVEEVHRQRYRLWRQMPPRSSGDHPETDYLREQSDSQVRYLNSRGIHCQPYQVELVASKTADLYATAPFPVLPPFPCHGAEVQILFEIDTSAWTGIISPRTGQKLKFHAPLRIKGDFNNWVATPMKPPASGSDGIWTLRTNVRIKDSLSSFAFEDASPERGAHESELMEIIKFGLHDLVGPSASAAFAFVPDRHRHLCITTAHVKEAIRLSRIKKP
ncbi:MAG: SGNH/GDSL hydrolase family protein [bacterium]